MIAGWRSSDPGARQAATLAALIVAQGLCAAFFIGDVIADIGVDVEESRFHLPLEAFVATVMIFGVIYFMIELRRLLARIAAMDTGLRAARGEMSDVIDGFFTDWALTPAERDVALMVLKGIDNDTIAGLRGTAPGTVRAQCTKIYGKAGVDGRAQLLSVFMEELLADD